MPLKSLRTALLAVMGMVVGMLVVSAWGSPLYPRVKVTFQNPVIVNSQTLPPGKYVFQEIENRGTPRVFRVVKPNGENLTLTSVAIRARAPLGANMATPVAQDTEVVLQKINGNYHLHKIWIQGRTRGWEFPIPEEVKSQATEMDEVVVHGTYEDGNSTAEGTTESNAAQSATSSSDQPQGEAASQTEAVQHAGSVSEPPTAEKSATHQINSVTGCLQTGRLGNSYYVRTSDGLQKSVQPADHLQAEFGRQVNHTVRLVGHWSTGDTTSQNPPANSSSMLPASSSQTGPIFRAERIDVIATNCSQ